MLKNRFLFIYESEDKKNCNGAIYLEEIDVEIFPQNE